MNPHTLIASALLCFMLHAQSAFALGVSAPKLPEEKEDPPITLAKGFRLGLGQSVGFISGNSGFGGDLQLMVDRGDKVVIGVQTGVVAFSATKDGVGESLLVVPALASLLYRFYSSHTEARPFVGALGGVAFTKGSLSTGSGTVGGGSKILLNAYVRLGIEIAAAESAAVYLDGKVGVLGEALVIMPTVGLIFIL